MRENSPSGYLHPNYVYAQEAPTAVRQLSRSGGWVFERPVPGTPWRRLVGGRPFFTCADWRALDADLAELAGEGGYVKLSLLTDPFAELDERLLGDTFDCVERADRHYVSELRLPLHTIVSRAHRERVRQALETVRVEVLPEAPPASAWDALLAADGHYYENAWRQRPSTEALARMLAVPGAAHLSATIGEDPVGLALFFIQYGVAYSHFLALSPAGLRAGAHYALTWQAVVHLGQQAAWLDLGGAEDNGAPASERQCFKEGWATGTRTAYRCERVLDRALYEELQQAPPPHGAEGEGRSLAAGAAL